ncbi:hypothetical protein AYO45_03600 [Gammaproteobacteria bacterium SCGC AG-212-F23]|nr:hypothetical protein AYO45_03600 [Gammaproteobacteria bacterium SCGC AG-212-F23]
MTTALICFDFDITIVSQNMANYIGRCNLSVDPWDYIKTNMPPRVSASAWKNLIIELLSQGHIVAIASNNKFTDMIKRYLTEIIGLDQATIDKLIFSIELFPAYKNDMLPKITHIDRVVNHVKNKIPSFSNKVLLVDDSFKEILEAKGRNCETVWADAKDDSFFNTIRPTLASLIKSNKAYTAPATDGSLPTFIIPCRPEEISNVFMGDSSYTGGNASTADILSTLPVMPTLSAISHVEDTKTSAMTASTTTSTSLSFTLPTPFPGLTSFSKKDISELPSIHTTSGTTIKPRNITAMSTK